MNSRIVKPQLLLLLQGCRKVVQKTEQPCLRCLYSTSSADKTEQTEQTESPPMITNIFASVRPQTVPVKAKFRTSETNPLNHTLSQEGMFYHVPISDKDTLFKKGPPVDFLRLSRTFQEFCMMVRRPALEVFDILRQLNYQHPAPRLLLYGKKGSGKTMSLVHIIHYCATDGWLVIHVPWVPYWLTRKTEKNESTHKPDRIDQPIEAAEWLGHFRLQNAALLKDVVTTKTYHWSKKEQAEEGMPILELIDFGTNRVKYATDCVGIVLREMKILANTNRFKMLVGIEAVNAFWREKGPNIHNRHWIPQEKLSMVNHFKKLLRSDWTNGVCVCTVDMQVNPEELRQSYTPQYLLGKQGFEFLDPFVPVLVPEYSDKEVHSCIEYYIDRLWIQNPEAHTEAGRKEIIFMSNKNPLHLTKVCASL